MRICTVIGLIYSILAIPGLSFSSDLASLAKEGYSLVEETRIAGDYGDYQGCVASKSLRFTNGKVFICSTFGYDNSQYMPVVYVLKNKDGAIKIVINGKEYSGTFRDGQ
jgi:hypothetical protein